MTRREALVLLLIAAVIAMPWLFFAWTARPGATRPIAGDHVLPFLLAAAGVVDGATRRRSDRRSPLLLVVGFGGLSASHAAFAAMVGEPRVFALLTGFTAFLVLLHLVVEGVFARRREGEAR